MSCDYNPYTLPTISFVGGETQDFAFNTYFYKDKKPFNLTGCSCNFAIVTYTNKNGAPILSKAMGSIFNEDGSANNVLTVTLFPEETVDLSGKYIYQITIKDIEGSTEIPNRGIMYITGNIDKNFIKQ